MQVGIPEFLPGQSGTGYAQRVQCVSVSNTPDLYYMWTEYTTGRYMGYPYLIIDGKWVRTQASTSQTTSLPYCLQQEEIMYKSEMTPIYYFMSVFLFMIVILMIYKIFIKRLMP